MTYILKSHLLGQNKNMCKNKEIKTIEVIKYSETKVLDKY